MSIEAMKQALEALEWDADYETSVTLQKAAITSLRQAIEQAEKQEPVAYINVEQRKLEWARYTKWDTPTVVNLPKIPLYTIPQPQREWVGLMRGVRVDGDTVVITVKGGNEAARQLCAELLKEKNT